MTPATNGTPALECPTPPTSGKLDASSLNGAYKVELAKAKRKYIEKRETPKFEPTDIVPLVNMAFPRSFGNRKNAIKAIADRGWNPLNFNILTTLPAAAKNVRYLT